jgi:hypothetical protein
MRKKDLINNKRKDLLNKFDDEFLKAWDNSSVECMHNWLEGIHFSEKPKEIYHAISSEEYALKLCNLFNQKFGKEIKYEFKKGLCYFSYVNNSQEE